MDTIRVIAWGIFFVAIMMVAAFGIGYVAEMLANLDSASFTKTWIWAESIKK